MRQRQQNACARQRYRVTHKATCALAKKTKKFQRQMEQFAEEERQAAEELDRRKFMLKCLAEECKRSFLDKYSICSKLSCLAKDCQARVLSKHGLSECSRWAYPPDRPKSCTVRDILERRRRATEDAIRSFDAEGHVNALLTAATSSSEGVSESAPVDEGGSGSAPVDEGGSKVGSEGDDTTVPPVPPEPPDDGLDRDAYIA